MSEPRGLRDLNRLKWVTIVLPIVFVWGFELVRFLVLDPKLTSDESHVAAAMIMGGAIVLFAMLVSVYLDRAQRQLVSQNKDLTVTHAVSSAVRGGLSLPDLLEQSLDRVVTETGALAGIVTVDGAGRPLTHHPPPRDARTGPRLAGSGPGRGRWTPPWTSPATPAGPASTRASWTSRSSAAPSASATSASPSTRRWSPTSREAALADIAGEIAGAAQLGMTVANLHRREREREALYAVALQLTGRADLRTSSTPSPSTRATCWAPSAPWSACQRPARGRDPDRDRGRRASAWRWPTTAPCASSPTRRRRPTTRRTRCAR